MKRLLLVVATLVLVWALHGGERATARVSAVCADYPNQRAAQLAHDTRDADGDGIYCEALPCPCLKPAGVGPGEAVASRGARRSPTPK